LNVSALQECLHENPEKDCRSQPGTGGNYAGFDFLKAPGRRRDFPATLDLQSVPLCVFSGSGHFRGPGPIPIGRLANPSIVENRAHGEQVSATRFAELNFFRLAGATARAKHKKTSKQNCTRIRRK
jgi:hypothetical protein